jgi:hypothetical protein
MHHIRMVVLWTLLIALVGGCGFGGSPESGRVISRGPAPLYDDTLTTVGFTQIGKESDWRDANTKDYFRVFTEGNGVELFD